jgi:hypothetical protein
MQMLRELDRRLQYGPGMRVQRVVEAAFLVVALFARDIRFAYVTVGLAAPQILSGRFAFVALAVAALRKPAPGRRLGDLYFDLRGSQGACAAAVVVMSAAIALVRGGHEALGFGLLTLPTASFLLSPTMGFCTGCAVYVAVRALLARIGLAKRFADGVCDVDIDRKEAPPGHQ